MRFSSTPPLKHERRDRRLKGLHRQFDVSGFGARVLTERLPTRADFSGLTTDDS